MLTKRIGALFMAVLFLLLFQPLSVYADQPLNSFLESDGNFYIYLENCTYIDSQKKEAPEEYGSSNYTDPYMYDIYVSDVPSDGNITIGFSSLYFDGEFPYVSSVGYTKADKKAYRKDEPAWNSKLADIIAHRSTSFTVNLKDGSNSIVLFCYYNYTYSGGYKKLDVPKAMVFNFVVNDSDYKLEDVTIKKNYYQFENKEALFGARRTAFLVLPYGCTNTVEADLTFSTSAIEVFLNDDGMAKPLIPNADGVLTVDLNVGNNHDNSINTISIRKIGGTEIEDSYNLYCLAQQYTGLPDKITDYLCIGSQYTNIEDDIIRKIYDYGLRGVRSLVGSNLVANSKISLSGPTSLGNFGGYITYYFENAIKDDPNNPYGIDFITFGNSYNGSNDFAEPGQVWVSEDGNIWYALAGSLHYEDTTNWNASITYSRADNGSTIITMPDGSERTQEYLFPEKMYYPWHDFGDDPTAPITMNGISIGVEEGSVHPLFPDFGYTDVGVPYTSLPEDYDTSRLSVSELSEGSALNVAGNPYLGSVKKGNFYYLSTTDGMDLSWAVDSDGQPVFFPNGIHYVKIVCANNIDGGDIGEKSTEVNMVRIARADEASVGISTAPNEITFDGQKINFTSGAAISANVFRFDDVAVDGEFEVKVDAPKGSHVYINNNPETSVTYDKIPDHKIVRVIVQNDECEPRIYVFNLREMTEDEKAADAVDELIEAIGDPEKVTLDSAADIQDAREAFDALTDAQKKLVRNEEALKAAEAKLKELQDAAADAEAAAAVEKKIDAIGEVALEKAADIQAARKALDGLTDGQKALVKNEETLKAAEAKLKELQDAASKEEADAAAAKGVSDKIAALGEISLESEDAVKAARDAYNALTDEQKELVKNEETLKAAEAKLQELQDAAAKDEANAAAAKRVDDKITALGDVSLKDEKAVEAARAAYDKLTEEQKALVKNADTLKAAEEKIAQLKGDTPKAQDVKKQIAAIGEVTKYKETEIQAARAAYEALTDSQKALVDNLAVLEAAEAELERLKEAASDPSNSIKVTFRLIGSTIASEDVDLSKGEEGYYGAEYQTWIKTKTYTMHSDDSVYDLFVKATGDAGVESKGASSGYVSSIKAPDALGGYWLSEFTNGKYSGWMYTMDGKHTNAIKDQKLVDGAEVVFHYTNDYRYEVEDWFDEPAYPAAQTDGEFYNRWLEAADVRPGSQGGSTPAAPATPVQPADPQAGQAAEDRFIDVKPTDWFAGAVDYAVEKGFMAGTGDKTFSPNRTLSRGCHAVQPGRRTGGRWTDNLYGCRPV